MTPDDLQEARVNLGLTQVELARVLGVHPNIVSRWSLGKAKIPSYLHLALKWLEAEKWAKSRVRARRSPSPR